MELFDDMYCAKIIVGIDVDQLSDFESKVKTKLSSRKYNWVVILLANYNSCSKAVHYVLENFTTIDILSDDIDFNLPGYSNQNDVQINSNNLITDNIVDEALSKLADNFDKDVSKCDILLLRERLLSLKAQPLFDDNDDYHGTHEATIINNKRLGKIYFREASFANFVADLSKMTSNRYVYLGGCDLVMVPLWDEKLQYNQCQIYRLDEIVNKESSLSIDGFLFRLLETLRKNKRVWEIPNLYQKSYKMTFVEFEKCYSSFLQLYSDDYSIKDISELKNDAKKLLSDSQSFFNKLFRKNWLMKRANDIVNRFKEQYDRIIAYASLRDIEYLYKMATKELPTFSNDEIIAKIISDIEHHVKWKLSDEFFFISYSTKDKMKAELIRRMLQEQGVNVWIAPDGIPQGRDYSMIIPTTLKYAKIFVLILTENSATSKWVSREIEAAINNGSTLLKIILADGFQLEQLNNYPDIGFYLNKVQVSYRYEDIIQDADEFKQFMH